MRVDEENDKFTILRKRYHTFFYHASIWQKIDNTIKVQFHFSIEDEFHFRPQSFLIFPSNIDLNMPEEQIDILVFYLGLIESISYWKATCSPQYVLKPYALDDYQSEWWKSLWYLGLGEFFWRNSIQVSKSAFMHVQMESSRMVVPLDLSVRSSNTYLVPIGGGKDSAVSMEILKQFTDEIIPFMINPLRAMLDTVRVSGIECHPVIMHRTIDEQLLELNRMGFLNGHTPFSALVAFASLLSASLLGISNIVVSHEASANEPTVLNTTVNHQYSKSLQFESDFRNYVHQYISPSIQYFSLLRPLTELQIALLFSNFEQYHSVFLSCNAGSKEDKWCGSCPKCLFTAIILLPFLDYYRLKNIFRKNILDDQRLLPVFQQLIGQHREKPFECVGTIEEVRMALDMSVAKWDAAEPLPWLLQWYVQQNLFRPQHISYFKQILNNLPNSEHYIQPELYEHLSAILRQVNS